MQPILRWSNRLASMLASIAAILAISMSIFVVLASVMRYLVGSPFAFTEELVGLLFTAMIFAGIPVATLRRSHIAVTIVPDLLGPVARRFIDRSAYAILAVFCLWFGMLTWDYLQITLALDARSAGSRLVLWPWTAVLPLSCFLSGLAALLRILVPESGHEDRTHLGAE
ncbi:TRAP transporter small permease subunit [Aurantimonas sp. DM33-3]|uniref:TRAP transporter small permease n=1 Tax=Aurantimonas sp. DM33-3 TaxID=2766955 RepID=UPI0016522F3B|nr:TRAP transporter small permease subunit [Aurantimonas sp. DM33-3]MBC6718609.1 TRAP transporter small permease subunit [Aurantimonas sp. DM33-3]